jgi:hypothetical protein
MANSLAGHKAVLRVLYSTIPGSEKSTSTVLVQVCTGMYMHSPRRASTNNIPLADSILAQSLSGGVGTSENTSCFQA